MVQYFYSIGTYHVSSNNLQISDTIYNNIDEALANINSEMISRIRDFYGIDLSPAYFLEEDSSKHYDNKFSTRENNILNIVANKWVVDIYLYEIKKGYIYNSSNITHAMKFFVKKHDSAIISEEDHEESDFSLIQVKNLYDKSQGSKIEPKKEKYTLKSCKITAFGNIESKTFNQVVEEINLRFGDK